MLQEGLRPDAVPAGRGMAERSGVATDHRGPPIDGVNPRRERVDESAIFRRRDELAVLELGCEEPGQVRLVPGLVVVDAARLVVLRQSNGEVVEFGCADLVHTVVTVPL